MLDPPYLQSMSANASTNQEVNSLAQINLGLPADRHCTVESFPRRVLESFLEATEENAIGLIWCSLEQALTYMAIHHSKELQPQGLNGMTTCFINGKRRSTNANTQLPAPTTEFFIVVKKGSPNQACWDKWGKKYDEEHPAPKELTNLFKVPQTWWDSLSNRYPYEKPRELMRLLVGYFAQPGQLVFEGFSGTISCGLAALTRGVNLVAVDNNQETKPFLKDLYEELRTGIRALEDLDDEWSNIEEHPAAHLFVSGEFETTPNYVLLGPADFLGEVEVVDTEHNVFVHGPRSQGSSSRARLRPPVRQGNFSSRVVEESREPNSQSMANLTQVPAKRVHSDSGEEDSNNSFNEGSDEEQDYRSPAF